MSDFACVGGHSKPGGDPLSWRMSKVGRIDGNSVRGDCDTRLFSQHCQVQDNLFNYMGLLCNYFYPHIRNSIASLSSWILVTKNKSISFRKDFFVWYPHVSMWKVNHSRVKSNKRDFLFIEQNNNNNKTAVGFRGVHIWESHVKPLIWSNEVPREI